MIIIFKWFNFYINVVLAIIIKSEIQNSTEKKMLPVTSKGIVIMVKSVFLKIPLYRDDERQKVCLDIISKMMARLRPCRAPGAPERRAVEFLAHPAVPP